MTGIQENREVGMIVCPACRHIGHLILRRTKSAGTGQVRAESLMVSHAFPAQRRFRRSCPLAPEENRELYRIFEGWTDDEEVPQYPGALPDGTIPSDWKGFWRR